MESNYLNLPKNKFGNTGIEAGNTLYKIAKSIKEKATITYIQNSSLIIINNIGISTIQELRSILDQQSFNEWHPKVESKDEEGNYFVYLNKANVNEPCLFKYPFSAPITLPTVSIIHDDSYGEVPNSVHGNDDNKEYDQSSQEEWRELIEKTWKDLNIAVEYFVL